jgi:two-component system cell cycle response regulator DivK
MSTSARSATVLLVEDNVDNRVIMRAWLEHAGFRVVMAGDGVASIVMARDELPDVILMDVALPGMDGWEAAARIKRNPRTQAIPIIALTALALPEDRRRANELKVDGYLTKPVALSLVLDEVRRVLGA